MRYKANPVSELLTRVYQSIESFERRKEALGQSYNIFEVLNVADKEVIMCRMLADLLSPDGAHGQDTRYLKCFIEQVLGIEGLGDRFYRTVNVWKEFCIPQSESGRDNRRIDIVIQGSGLFLPIEAKIHAEDQGGQCYDYYKYAEKYMGADKARVYYLTMYGTSPTDPSVRSEKDPNEQIPEGGVVNLSFRNHICQWLREIIETEPEGRVKELLAQYLEAIEKITGAIGEGEGQLVERQILRDSSSFAAAIQVAEAIDRAKVSLIKNLMGELREEMTPLLPVYGLRYLGPDSYYSVERQADRFYQQSDSSYPGLNYLVERAILQDGKQIWFRIEIDWRLFAGFCLFDPEADHGKGYQVDDTSEWAGEISRYFADDFFLDNESWWISWRYLPSGTHNIGNGEEEAPEFKSVNETVIRLADAGFRHEMVRRCIRVIEDELLSQLKRGRK